MCRAHYSLVTASRRLLLVLAAAPWLHAAESARDLVIQSLSNYKLDHAAAPQFTYMERDEELNGGSTKVSISKVFPVNGLPYEYTVSRNGSPLTGDAKAREDSKLQKRRNESADDRAKRQKDYVNSLKFLDDVPNALRFKMLGEETLNGRPNYVIQCTPNPSFQPHDSRAAMFSHIAAKLWIDRADIRWTKALANVLDTISIGWVVARIQPGAKIELQLACAGGKHWLPSLIDVNGDARVFLIKDHPIREHITYYDFQPAR